MAKVETALYTELDSLIRDQQYSKAIKICDELLGMSESSTEVLTCKLLCYIHLGQFKEALSFLKSGKNVDYKFEEAYCLYRLRQYEKSLKIISSFPEPRPQRVRELEAQIFYSIEEYEKSAELFEDILASTDSEEPDAELITNTAAALTMTGQNKKCQDLSNRYKSIVKESYELAFNVAGSFIGQNDLNEAQKHLELALDICLASLRGEGWVEDDIEKETCSIRTQLGYIHQLQGNSERAHELYSEVLSVKEGSEVTAAVASNNLVALRGTEHLLNSEKKLKHASSPSVIQKLTSTQKQAIEFNKCLVLYHMHKMKECLEAASALEGDLPHASSAPILIEAAALFNSKKLEEAETLLRKYSEESGEGEGDNLPVRLTLAQMLLSKGDIIECLKVLEALEDAKHAPGLVSAMVSLYQQIEEDEKANSLLEEHTKWWSSLSKDSESKNYLTFLKARASHSLALGNYKEAKMVYNKILDVNRNDKGAIPAVILACASIEPEAAEKYAKRLPLVDTSDVDVESLKHSLTVSVSSRSQREPSGKGKEVIEDEASKTIKKKKTKTKKKKKPRLPKDFDPATAEEPDPERWIPKRDRSYYKRSRRGQIGRGSQGSTNYATNTRKTSTSTQKGRRGKRK